VDLYKAILAGMSFIAVKSFGSECVRGRRREGEGP
jgi:hypothetical protein